MFQISLSEIYARGYLFVCVCVCMSIFGDFMRKVLPVHKIQGKLIGWVFGYAWTITKDTMPMHIKRRRYLIHFVMLIGQICLYVVRQLILLIETLAKYRQYKIISRYSPKTNAVGFYTSLFIVDSSIFLLKNPPLSTIHVNHTKFRTNFFFFSPKSKCKLM